MLNLILKNDLGMTKHLLEFRCVNLHKMIRGVLDDCISYLRVRT